MTVHFILNYTLLDEDATRFGCQILFYPACAIVFTGTQTLLPGPIGVALIGDYVYWIFRFFMMPETPDPIQAQNQFIGDRFG